MADEWRVGCLRVSTMTREAIGTAVILASAAMFVASLAAIPWFLVTLPADHFVRPPPQRPLVVHVLRNTLGATLIALGVVMLVLPGQGLLTILLGVSIAELPFKRRLLRRLLAQRGVHDALDALRRRAGRPPLELPEHVEGEDAR